MSKINFAQTLDMIDPLDSCGNRLRINNIVGTVKLLNEGETICLESIAAYYGGLVKYAPKKFAAAILRVKDPISTTTCLAFRSGKIVVVGAHSKNHSLCACQRYRRMIESVPSIYSDQGKCSRSQHKHCSQLLGILGQYTLANRTQFRDWRVTNIVSNFDIGYRPDLKRLAEMLADLSNWNPELFPGLKLLAWLRPKSECTCQKKKKNKSCKCNSRVLLFDTGKAVFTGCKTLDDVNKTRFIIEQLMSDTEFHEKEDEPIRKDRFESRREKIIKAAHVEFVGWAKPPTAASKRRAAGDGDPVAAVFDFMEGRKVPATKKRAAMASAVAASSEVAPIITACKLDQLDNVSFLASCDRDQLLEALEFVQDRPNEVTEEMIELIESLT